MQSLDFDVNLTKVQPSIAAHSGDSEQLFEPRSGEYCERPLCARSAGKSPIGDQTSRPHFFGHLSLAEQRKVPRPEKGETKSHGKTYSTLTRLTAITHANALAHAANT